MNKKSSEALDRLVNAMNQYFDQGLTEITLKQRRALIEVEPENGFRKYEPGPIRIEIEMRNPDQTGTEEWTD